MSTLLERLRQETRPLHEQTEQLFYTDALKDGTLSVIEYGHLLKTHLLFHQALEAAIDDQPGFFREYEPEIRRKTAWLVADLTRLHEALPVYTPSLFANWSAVGLLGAAYVGEGSMLGGMFIWRLLQKNDAIEPLLEHARFYQGYGSATGNYWRSFGDFLTRQGETNANEVVSAASQAFVNYQAIFRAVSPSVAR